MTQEYIFPNSELKSYILKCICYKEALKGVSIHRTL